jgi:hypothetical protein
LREYVDYVNETAQKSPLHKPAPDWGGSGRRRRRLKRGGATIRRRFTVMLGNKPPLLEIAYFFFKEKNMKKRQFFVIFALICGLTLSRCDTSSGNNGGGNSNGNNTKLPSLTIKNESSFVLSDVIFAGISFSSPNSSDLLRTGSSVKQLSADALNKAGYIYFTRNDIGIACRTSAAISIADKDDTFTFTDNTPVEEVGNDSNNGRNNDYSDKNY